ncbi:MAG: glycosyltransferase [Deltaproteobacteria bacterium]|nr:glycosyltransferase [Deltaproteobacteria bacterium]
MAAVAYLWTGLCAKFDILFLQKAMVVTLPCLAVARLKRKCVIIDFDDLDSHWQAPGWKACLTRAGEYLMPRWADAITTHNTYLKAYLDRICPKPKYVIPQGVDSTLFNRNRRDGDLRRQDLGLSGKKVLCFLGSFTRGSAADLDIILEAVRILTDRNEHFVLMIVGGEGPLEEQYRQDIERLGLTRRVIISGRVDQKEVPCYLRLADYGLVCMRDNMSNRFRVSLKVLEYLAMGLTVIGHVVGGTRDALGDFCFLCEPTAQSLAETIQRVSMGKLRKKSARDFIVKNLDWEIFVPLLDHVIKDCQRAKML